MLHLMNLVTHSAVLTSLVIVISVVLFIVEAFSPHTFGIVGVIGVVVIGALLYAYQITGIGYWIGPLIAIFGVVLVLVEAFGIHFHGVLMLLGSTAIGVGMYFALGAGTNAGMATTAGISVMFCAVYITIKLLPLSTFWRRSGSANTLHLPSGDSLDSVATSTQCVAASDLRPCGMVVVNGRRYPARSIDGLVRAGTNVVVKEVRKYEVIVTVELQ